MELFPRYTPSVEEEKRDKADRARLIGFDLLFIAICLGISFVSTLAGDFNEDVYIHYPQLRPLNMIFACIGLVWVAAVVLYYFLVKKGTRKRLIGMYALDAVLMVFLALRLILSDRVAFPHAEPDIWMTVVEILLFFYIPIFHLIYYRKSKINLVE